MINKILHLCSCITELITLLGKIAKMLGKASRLIIFPNSFNKFTHVRSLQTIYMAIIFYLFIIFL